MYQKNSFFGGVTCDTNGNYIIRKVHIGDGAVLAHIQTESWKATFRGLLQEDVLRRCMNRYAFTVCRIIGVRAMAVS